VILAIFNGMNIMLHIARSKPIKQHPDAREEMQSATIRKMSGILTFVATPIAKEVSAKVSTAKSVEGQTRKYSLRADIVRFASVSGLKSDIAGGPVRAKSRLMHGMQSPALSVGGLISEGIFGVSVIASRRDPYRKLW
jgi:hypothetical protein